LDAAKAAPGTAATVKLGRLAFPGLGPREFDDTRVTIVQVVVKDGNDTVLETFDFPDGRFKVEFHGPNTGQA
jgi:hypothetical protein